MVSAAVNRSQSANPYSPWGNLPLQLRGETRLPKESHPSTGTPQLTAGQRKLLLETSELLKTLRITVTVKSEFFFWTRCKKTLAIFQAGTVEEREPS